MKSNVASGLNRRDIDTVCPPDFKLLLSGFLSIVQLSPLLATLANCTGVGKLWSQLYIIVLH